MSLLPEGLFDLSEFSHINLFEKDQFVWLALAKIKEYLKNKELGKIEIQIPKDVYLVNPEMISIGKGTIIEPGAYIKGPCIIGENCSIRHGAYIRGDLITGDHCVIGHATEIKHSILLNHANAAHFAYVGDSILGNGVNLGAGTRCANLKLDKGNISVYYKQKFYQTNLRKFGAIIGDHSQFGCNSVSNPGTIMGKNVLTYPCSSFGGVILENSVIKPREKNLILQSKAKVKR